MSASTLFPFRRRESFAFLLLGLACGLALPFGTAQSLPDVQPGEPITDARTCAALAVYTMGGADANDWALKASVGAVVLNSFDPATHGAPCGRGVEAVLQAGLSAERWQFALDVVDAVAIGDYWLPEDCYRATRILPPDSSVQATTSCVIDGYAFVRGTP